MTIGVSHDLDTGNVVLINAIAQTMYDFSPPRAHQLAAKVRTAASSGSSVLVIAVADDGREFRIGGTAENAISTADDIDRNADLGMTIQTRIRASRPFR